MSEPTAEVDVRALLIQELNQQAIEAFRTGDAIESQFRDLAAQKRHLLRMRKLLNVSDEEAVWQWQELCSEATSDKTEVDRRLLDTAHDFVQQAYKHGKYDGRELSDLFRLMFERIDPKLRRDFEAAIS